MKNYINKRIKYYYKLRPELNINNGVNIKNAFYGGRTNNIQFYQKVDGEEFRIRYLDFTSLYPFVLKTKQYPLEHPEVINEDFDYTLDSYELGFVECTLLAPDDKYLPVLPLTINCKLSFPLFYTCARDKTKECTHHIEGRVLKGTWTTVELKEALKQGYKIIDIIEVLNYKKTSDELFSGFINTQLKVN